VGEKQTHKLEHSNMNILFLFLEKKQKNDSIESQSFLVNNCFHIS